MWHSSTGSSPAPACRSAGQESSCSIASTFTPGGHYVLDQLFRFEDVTEDCAARLAETDADVEAFKAIVAQDHPPAVEIGEHCHAPYTCPYWGHYMHHIVFPQLPVGLLPKLQADRRADLVGRGLEIALLRTLSAEFLAQDGLAGIVLAGLIATRPLLAERPLAVLRRG